MIAARVKQTGYRMRLEVARFNPRLVLVLTLAIALAFLGAYELGRVTRTTKAARTVEQVAAPSVAFVHSGIPRSMSAVPPLAQLALPKPVHKHVSAAPPPAPAPALTPAAPIVNRTPQATVIPSIPAPVSKPVPSVSPPRPSPSASKPSGGETQKSGGESFDSSG